MKHEGEAGKRSFASKREVVTPFRVWVGVDR